jgi:hypothetical protein
MYPPGPGVGVGGFGLGSAQAGRPKPPELTFDKLWQGYPSSKPYVDKSGDPPKGFENQCAIKVSVALHAAGVDMKSFRGATVTVDGKRLAIRAEELAAWLKTQHLIGLPLKPENVTGKEWQEKIKGRRGIAFFANYWARPGEARNASGDHIDLWNGSRLTMSGFEGTLVTIARFGLGMDSSPRHSNLGNATSILFWEVR